MAKIEINQLLRRYADGQASEQEILLLEKALLEFNEDEPGLPQDRLDAIKREVYGKLPSQSRGKVRLYAWASAAAAVVILFLGLLHWKLEDSLRLSGEHVVVQDFGPGSNRATLKLADGKMIGLDGGKDGLVVVRDSMRYLDGSKLVADQFLSSTQTLSTPNAGQYHLVLGDGTKVWLNAASSITFPTSFDHVSSREVAVTGEVYFEVAPNKLKPFLVRSENQTVKVLGTHFNINDYGDGAGTITTLLEGKVSVTSGAGMKLERLLAPGQQALSDRDGIEVSAADVALALAWKNGRLEFRDADLKTIMRQVARWYDLKVEYKGEVAGRVFSGSVARSSNLSVLLKILAYSDIKFTLETNGTHRKLIVEP